MRARLDTTQLVQEARAGDREAFGRLFAHVHGVLREIAHRQLRRHRVGETLGAAAPSQASSRELAGHESVAPRDRVHSLAVASRSMHALLVDFARSHSAADRDRELLALADVLERLAAVDTRLREVVEYRVLGGLTLVEIAVVSGRSTATVKRDWSRARARLYRWLGEAPGTQRRS